MSNHSEVEPTIHWVGLDPKARLLFYLQAFSRWLFFWVPVSVVASAGSSFLIGPMYAGIAGVLVLFFVFLAALWIPSLSFDRWAYATRGEDILIARGVFLRVITAIPISRIQHVDTQQGPLEQWLGLARVQIHTASGLWRDGVIPGLQIPDAEHLRDQLLRVRGDGGV